MLEHLSSKIALNWSKKNIIPREDVDIYRFGIEIGISTIVNILFLILATILFFDPVDLIIFIVFFIALRQYSGGYHADTHIKCNVLSLLCYSLCTIIAHHVTVGYISISILFLVGLAMMVITAPIKNHNKTITPKQLPKYKITAITLFVLEIIITYALRFFKNPYSSNAFCTILCIIILMPVGMISYNRKEAKLCLNS